MSQPDGSTDLHDAVRRGAADSLTHILASQRQTSPNRPIPTAQSDPHPHNQRQTRSKSDPQQTEATLSKTLTQDETQPSQSPSPSYASHHAQETNVAIEKDTKAMIIDAVDADGMSALHLACWSGQTELVRLLINAGASAFITDCTGHTALHRAAFMGHVGACQALLDCVDRERDKDKDGAWKYLSCQNQDGDTALHLAAACGHERVLRCLLRPLSGAVFRLTRLLTLPNNDGDSPLQLASLHPNPAAANYLTRAIPTPSHSALSSASSLVTTTSSPVPVSSPATITATSSSSSSSSRSKFRAHRRTESDSVVQLNTPSDKAALTGSQLLTSSEYGMDMLSTPTRASRWRRKYLDEKPPSNPGTPQTHLSGQIASDPNSVMENSHRKEAHAITLPPSDPISGRTDIEHKPAIISKLEKSELHFDSTETSSPIVRLPSTFADVFSPTPSTSQQILPVAENIDILVESFAVPAADNSEQNLHTSSAAFEFLSSEEPIASSLNDSIDLAYPSMRLLDYDKPQRLQTPLSEN